MDFRGRVYPVPPHLSHLGSDLARSMLVFAESRPLGPNGLDWLKIHCINLTGLMKSSRIVERLAYANEITDDILDSADKPLTVSYFFCELVHNYFNFCMCSLGENVVGKIGRTLANFSLLYGNCKRF